MDRVTCDIVLAGGHNMGRRGSDAIVRIVIAVIVGISMHGTVLAETGVPSAELSGNKEPAPVAVLVYADDIEEVEVLDFTGTPVGPVDFGTKILIGFGIRTNRSSAEIRLEPNGSLVRVSEDTFVKIEELQGLENTRLNSAALIEGTMRFVAASQDGENYRITTRSVALGVRGTDFIVSVDGDGETTVAVQEGRVEAFDPISRGTAPVVAGEALTAGAGTLSSIPAESESLQQLRTAGDFVGADETAVPRRSERTSAYENTFDYFQDLERDAYLEFFADDDFFDDYQKYIARFRSYYESEMEEFAAVLEREAEELERRSQEADDAIDAEDRAFQEWLEGQ